MLRVVIAALLGAVVAYGWGRVSAQIIPWETIDPTAADPAADVTSAVHSELGGTSTQPITASNEPTEGRPAGSAAPDPFPNEPRPGVLARLAVYLGGPEWLHVGGFLLTLLLALLIASAMHHVATDDASYMQRLVTVGLLGVSVAITVHLAAWNWLGLPLGATLITIADVLIGWMLAGLLMAAIIRPRPHVTTKG